MVDGADSEKGRSLDTALCGCVINTQRNMTRNVTGKKRSPSSRRGNRMLELNKIYCMDCLEGMKQISDNSIDLILTDPPWDINKKEYERGDGLEIVKSLCPELSRVLKINGHLLFDISFEQIFKLNQVLEPYFSFRQPIILYCNNQIGHRSYAGWNHFRIILWYCKKDMRTPVKRKYRDVFEFSMKSLKKEDWIYPNPKSVESYEFLLKMFSLEGDIVLDIFIGSGTTAIASKKLKRHFIGFEKEQEYVDIANKRLSIIKEGKGGGEMTRYSDAEREMYSDAPSERELRKEEAEILEEEAKKGAGVKKADSKAQG